MLKNFVGPIQRRILGAAAALGLFGASAAVAAPNCITADLKAQGECLYQVVPVVISAPGAHGAFFRTSVTIISRLFTISGRLVFHPAGQIGSDSDPSLSFVLSGEIRTIPDVVVAIGASGLGSLDVLLSTGLPMHSLDLFTFAELYNDSAGHPASPDEAVFPIDNFSLAPGANILSLYYSGFEPVPDLENRRLRLGVRTLSGTSLGCRMTFQLFDLASLIIPVALSEQVLPANYFQQFDPAELFGRPLQAGQLIVVSPNPSVGCPTIAYVAVADNVTNAPSIRLFRATTYQTF
jgi:hypothetical protein